MKETALAVQATPRWLDWLEHHLLRCPFKEWTQLDCPGCGFQRSFIALLKGDFAASWHFYPPGIFLLLTLVVLVIHLKFDLKHGAFILKILYIVAAVVMGTNYIYKIVNHQLL
ncbi:MAG: DUF2752 domain-containing protein [Sphingobacteriales bacterium]|nr:MAG: DUF2752 domain-containing protein [Sphingobacteriales bacterium]